MKSVILLLCAVSFGRSERVADLLLDGWLADSREMMDAAQNKDQTVAGLQFMTDCGAFITHIKCNATADVGIVSDLSTLKRNSSLTLTPSNSILNIELDLSYRVYAVHYPNLFISGNGIKMIYKGIDASTTSPIVFHLSMQLDYSKGVDSCMNHVTVARPTSSNNYTVIATIQEPRATMSVDSDLSKAITAALWDVGVKHIQSLFTYENVCTKLANLL